MTRLRDERGMTLVELLFAMSIAVIIFGAAVVTFVEFLDVSSRSDNQTQAQDTARMTVDRFAAQFRNAMSSGSTTASPIEQFGDFDIVFLAPLPSATITTTNPRGLYHIRYCLGNANNKNDVLWYQSAPFNSSTQPTPPDTKSCPDNGWGVKTAVADHVVNRSQLGSPALFSRTFDSNGATTFLKVNAIVDWNPNKDPDATQLTTVVNLRNVNRIPVATATCAGIANGHIQCDGSAAYDPDGQTLSYAWAIDGSTVAGQTTSKLDQSGFAAKSNHTVVLTVTDPGGATATYTKQVSMP